MESPERLKKRTEYHKNRNEETFCRYGGAGDEKKRFLPKKRFFSESLAGFFQKIC